MNGLLRTDVQPPDLPRSSPRSAGQWAAVRRQRRVWNRRAGRWAEHVDANDGLQQVVTAVVAIARACAGPRIGTVVDLGTGSGQVLLALAPDAERAIAVDVSDAMLGELATAAAAAGIGGIEPMAAAIEQLDLPAGSVDLVISNYALHHLRDRDKAALLVRVRRWLRPGGWLVLGDMMLGRGADPADRAVIAGKVRALARRGPGGWWRIVKNAVRFVARTQERPLPPAAWEAMARGSGFTDVVVQPIVHEAHVLVARAPG